RLIDYDGMYVPALQGMLSNEIGQANYQHPLRSAKDFDAKLDNFSEWVIYLALVVYGSAPGLLDQLNVADDHLFLKKSDYTGPEESQALRRLEDDTDPQLQPLGYLFESQIYALAVDLIEPVPAALAAQFVPATAPERKSVAGAGWVLDHTATLSLVHFSEK